jgi:hypothetical protein
VTGGVLTRRNLLLLEPPAPPRGRSTDRSEELGGRLAPVAETMVDLAGITPGQTVLAAAAGNQALAKAVQRRGGVVETSESVRFGWPDAAFDAVLAFFSVTSFANPRLAADELKRVARPGASIVLASWKGQAWSRYETAYRHFFGFSQLDVTDHTLPESGMGYSLVFARKP